MGSAGCTNLSALGICPQQLTCFARAMRMGTGFTVPVQFAACALASVHTAYFNKSAHALTLLCAQVSNRAYLSG